MGLLLIVLGVGVMIIVRKLGYLEYFATDKIFGWLRDLSDEAGFTQGRRSFLSLQIEIGNAQNLDGLWENVCRAMEIMHFDRGELHLLEKTANGRGGGFAGVFAAAPAAAAYDGGERRRAGEKRGGTLDPAFSPVPDSAGVYPRESGGGNDGIGIYGCRSNNPVHASPHPGLVRVWARGPHRRGEDVCNDSMLRIEIPLGMGNVNLFRLVLLKNLMREPVHPYTLRRVEHLRRSVMSAMNRLHPAHAPAPSFAPTPVAARQGIRPPEPVAVGK
jgi:UDP-GlcNAc:undecaprenyl-phosphate GlcNAc-1-phosphate transferase